MSDVAMKSSGASEGAFNARTMLFITAIGILAFIAMLLLGAYAPDLRSGRNGGTHALSNAATGFSGIIRLADATGRNPAIVRVTADLQSEDLTVITPDHGWTQLGQILDQRGARATLLVLPKWETSPDQEHSGWVRVSGLLPPEDPGHTLFPQTPLQVARSKRDAPLLRVVEPAAAPPALQPLTPAIVQTMSGKGLTPLITTQHGGIILAKLGDRPFYILSEPDLLNNHGMGDERQARSALALLDYLNSTNATSVEFDVTANGLGRSRSPLKLAFDPPFLAVTLTIFAAMLLAGWQALARFGPVRRPERAIAFGKAALVDNSAALIRKAGREAHLGARYVEVVREQAMMLFHLPPTLDPATLNSRFEEMNSVRSFAAAADAASEAHSRGELLSAAQSLHQWFEEAQQ